MLIHLKKYDVCYFKIGVSNGLGTKNGDVIISNNVVNKNLENIFSSIECGTTYEYPTAFKDTIAKELLAFSHAHGFTNAYSGVTLSAHDFNDMQIIMRDALTPDSKRLGMNKYFNDAYNLGVRCIDIESLSFAGFCTWLDIPACIINVSIADLLAETNPAITVDMQLSMISKFAQNFPRDHVWRQLIIYSVK